MTDTVGVLLLAYGTPASLSDVGEYYTHIRRGRPPTPELLEELTGRYRAIGGSSPLLAIARDQASGLERLLRERWSNTEFRVALGMKHAPPFIEEAVATLAGHSVDQTVVLVLAPHYSALSIGEYLGRVRAAPGAESCKNLTLIREWHLEPGYIELLAGRVRSALGQLRADGGDRPHVLFTAHSLPSRILESGDPYPVQVQETARAVAELVGIESWSVAWQSAGRTSDQWIGPDVCEVVRELGSQADHNAVLVCPAGFVSDHLELLYDLDIACRGVAAEAEIRFARTAAPNADPDFLEVLAQLVSSRLSAPVA